MGFPEGGEGGWGNTNFMSPRTQASEDRPCESPD
jgi:GTPase involved in cell partitioning and DNA repair